MNAIKRLAEMQKVTGRGGKEYISLADALKLAQDLKRATDALEYYACPTHGLHARIALKEIG